MTEVAAMLASAATSALLLVVPILAGRWRCRRTRRPPHDRATCQLCERLDIDEAFGIVPIDFARWELEIGKDRR